MWFQTGSNHLLDCAAYGITGGEYLGWNIPDIAYETALQQAVNEETEPTPTRAVQSSAHNAKAGGRTPFWQNEMVKPVNLEAECRSCKYRTFRVWKRSQIIGHRVMVCECVACNYMNVFTENPADQTDFDIELKRDEDIAVVFQSVRCPKCGGETKTDQTRHRANYKYREHICKSCDNLFSSFEL